MKFSLQCVTPVIKMDTREFCLTDCGPSEGCNPDDRYVRDEDSPKKDTSNLSK